MSSNTLNASVPVLTGQNYQAWVAPMRHYLRSQGQWLAVTKKPPTKKETVGDETKDVPVSQDTWDKWEELNSRALGNICLRLAPSI